MDVSWEKNIGKKYSNMAYRYTIVMDRRTDKGYGHIIVAYKLKSGLCRIKLGANDAAALGPFKK